MLNLEKMELGISKERLTLSLREEVQQFTLALAQQARRKLDICGRALDPELYEDAGFVSMVRSFITKSRHSRVRMLVLQPDLLHRRGHALINLAQQFSSFCELRVPAEAHREFNEAMCLADEVGFMHRRLADRYAGLGCFHDPAMTGELTLRFNSVWDAADSDHNFRRLGI